MAILLELHTADENLKGVLSNGRKYYVPKFQRDYSWEKEQWENLWDDIELIVQGEEKYHYMGYLVVQPQENTDKLQIIDGQQRLTTFSLIVLSAIKRLEAMGGEGERIKELENTFIGSKDLVQLKVENKLKLNRNNDFYYMEAVEGRVLPKRGQKKTVHLMEQALENFYDQFCKIKTGEKIGEFIEKMSSGLLFTTITIGNELNAYKIFETLNARGVQLSSSDLLKNYIFSLIDKENNMPDETIDRLDEKWEKIGNNIGAENYTDFILTEWNSRNKLVRKTLLFKNIRTSITDQYQANDYFNILFEKSDPYAALLDHENEFWKDHQHYHDIKNDLYFLKLFNIRQPLSLLLASYVKQQQNFSTILKWIKVFSLRYNVICREHTGEQESLYNKISSAIENGCSHQEIKGLLLSLYPSDSKFEQSFIEKTLLTKQSNKKAKYLLARLSEYMGNTKIDEITLTVEHILPLNPSEEWIKYFGANYNSYNERIGNFALVTTKENHDLDQELFLGKKKMLLNSQHQINHSVGEYEEWNYETVEARQKILANAAVQFWKIN